MYAANTAYDYQTPGLAPLPQAVAGILTLPATSEDIAKYVFAQLTLNRKEQSACELATD